MTSLSAACHAVVAATAAVLVVMATTGPGGPSGVDASPRFPFLGADDSDETICASALRYVDVSRRTAGSPPASRYDQNFDEPDEAEEEDDDDNADGDEVLPVAIGVNTTVYAPSQPLQVTLSSTVGLRGLLLQARRHGQPGPVGQFLLDQRGEIDARLINCSGPGSAFDTLVAWYGSAANNATFTWIAPDRNIGPLEFVGTLFADVGRYWTNVTSATLRKGFIPIDLSGCGKAKGCFRYHSGGDENSKCDSQTCEYLLTYRVIGDSAEFEMSANADWVAVGFSSDDRMGGDDVFMCVRTRSGGATVQTYINELGYVNPVLNKQKTLTDEQWEVTGDPFSARGGRVSCRFRRKMKVMFDQKSVDLSTTWYQLYAWGPVSQSDIINRHELDRPPTSDFKITLRAARDEYVSGATWRTPDKLMTVYACTVAIAAAAAAASRCFLPLFSRHP